MTAPLLCTGHALVVRASAHIQGQLFLAQERRISHAQANRRHCRAKIDAFISATQCFSVVDGSIGDLWAVQVTNRLVIEVVSTISC
jgi:hypothetical protein